MSSNIGGVLKKKILFYKTPKQYNTPMSKIQDSASLPPWHGASVHAY